MTVGILSDSHGDAATTGRAVALLEARGATALFHCGDVCALTVLDELVGRPAWFVWGNCDQPTAETRRYVERVGLTWPQSPVRVTLAGRSIALLHGHEPEFDAVVSGGECDYVFCGHTHVRADVRVGRTRVVNPGALHRARKKSVALLDLSRDALEFLNLSGERLS
ncbi:MAG: metallophosphoesterase family protein [Phycisphaerae bacterium]